MFGPGFLELVIIGGAALVLIGPQKMPEVARQLGKFFVHMRRMTTDVRSQIDKVIRDAEAEIIAEERDAIRKLMAIKAEVAQPFSDKVVAQPAPSNTTAAGSNSSDHNPFEPSIGNDIGSPA